MAYIPPHRRHLKDSVRPSPFPDFLVPQFERNLNLKSSNYNSDRKDKEVVSWKPTIFAAQIFGYADQFSALLLEPHSLKRRADENPLDVVGIHAPKGVNESTRSCERSPWISITEKIQDELQRSVQNAMNEMDLQESEEVKPYFGATFGQLFFHQRSFSQLDTFSRKPALETALSHVKRSFYGGVPSSYFGHILHDVIPKIGVDFDEEEEYYSVHVFDKCRPHVTLSCKCSAMKMEGKLELYEILPLKENKYYLWSANQVRHLVVDMSCPEKDLDLRWRLITLPTEKIMEEELTHDEMDDIKNLIASAIIDPNVEGGLRWSEGKETFGDRYNVVRVWHIQEKSFKNSSMKIKLEDVDCSTGGDSKEVNLEITGINALLQDRKVEIGPINKLLEDTLKLICEQF